MTLLIISLTTLALAAALELRCHRVGGLLFFRFGRFGGSLYLARAGGEV